MPLCRSFARRFARGQHDLEDLEQAGYIGALKAIDRFDSERGVLLSTYAVPFITGEMKRHLRDNSWAVKVPRSAKELAVRIEGAMPALTAQLGRSPTIAEIAAHVQAPAEMVIEAMEARAAAAVTSLEHATSGESPTFDGQLATEDSGYEQAEARATVEPFLRGLTDRDRLVLRLRFLEGLTQAEIGERIGVSQMHVSRILRAALVRGGASLGV